MILSKLPQFHFLFLISIYQIVKQIVLYLRSCYDNYMKYIDFMKNTHNTLTVPCENFSFTSSRIEKILL